MNGQDGRSSGSDEPVIGGSGPTPFSEGGRVEPVIGASPAAEPPPAPLRDPRIDYPPPPQAPPPAGHEPYPGDEYGDEYYDGYEDEYYDDEDAYPAYGAPPPRQPLVYLMIALGVVLMGVLGFLLFTVLSNDNGNGDDIVGQVVVDAPTANEVIPVEREYEVISRASIEEPVSRFELVIDGEVIAEEFITELPENNQYASRMTTTFDEPGTYTLLVRAVVDAEHTIESDPVTIVVVESLNGDEDRSVQGTVIATVTLRAAPDPDADARGTLEPGDTVRIIGKTQDVDWLLIDRDGGVWIPRDAVQVEDSLALVPFAEPTPTPEATETPTEEPSPTPTPEPAAPDFLPTDAVIVQSGGQSVLQVSVENVSSEGYSGVLTVAVSGIAVSTSEVAASVDIGPNEGATFNFTLTSEITENTSVTVTVDPGNAVEESSEDNNSTTFTVTPPVSEPDIAISAEAAGSQIDITMTNAGGSLQSAGTLRLEWDGGASEAGVQLDLPSGESQSVTVDVSDATGETIIIRLLVGGEEIAAGEVANPNAGEG